MDSPLVVLGSILVAACLFFAGVCWLAIWINAWQCGNIAEQMGVQHRYTAMTGCMIKPKTGDWVPLANYRVL